MSQAAIAGQNEITNEFKTPQSKKHIQYDVGSNAATLKGSKQSVTVIDAIENNAGTFSITRRAMFAFNLKLYCTAL